MKRRAFVGIAGSVGLTLAGCLAPSSDPTGSPATPCPPIGTETDCDPMHESVVKTEAGAPVDSYRSSILLSFESLPRCEQALVKRAVEEGALRICGTGPPALGSFAQRASEAAVDHELYLAYRGTGYRLAVRILDEVYVG